ncbi:SMI1/KNR4 family protein [Pseudomonas aeruginosa]|uniref:SMI1/KNR4 family protein n=1 Tax=Pseudomonas aeruginosa TaxID=287 RepID=UPI0021F1CF65|nr:SMI1/KNR4 family protein [Pseudomonas aeruginosa]MCV6433198.1 SMI1/KNR4 family protein [Pseudomonas aeruginosa]MCV6440828.1 SMI1/KNR4 family protein [Pseudomonas aeruginosa]HBP1105782.1 SMI1/KNR4 family protein [Pseudomonas aeruginosa]HCE7043638.1 SMI1/KNR4 family protein [Pseudomonas aeruginosa]HCE7539293.1 SMI1/KNR4 family protein [Pseudomonas aeruginosa]
MSTPTAADRIAALVARVNDLEQRSEDADVCWVGPSTESAIAAVEVALGVRIEGSFRTFLLQTGGGGVDMFVISAVYADGPLGGLGTVHGDTLHYRQAFWPSPLPPHLVVVQRCQDDNEPFCLDTSRIVAGEHPVVLHYLQSQGGHADRISPSFIDFLEKYLEPHFEAEG